MIQKLTLEHNGRVLSVEADHIATMSEDANGREDWFCSVRFRLEGEERTGTGDSTEKALQRIEDTLPPGWHVRTCASCGHGHDCPYGNADNEIFCFTDFQPKDQRDLWPTELYFADGEGHYRGKSLFSCCDRWIRPSPEDYWYNDFRFRAD